VRRGRVSNREQFEIEMGMSQDRFSERRAATAPPNAPESTQEATGAATLTLGEYLAKMAELEKTAGDAIYSHLSTPTKTATAVSIERALLIDSSGAGTALFQLLNSEAVSPFSLYNVHYNQDLTGCTLSVKGSEPALTLPSFTTEIRHLHDVPFLYGAYIQNTPVEEASSPESTSIRTGVGFIPGKAYLSPPFWRRSSLDEVLVSEIVRALKHVNETLDSLHVHINSASAETPSNG
jgi:hypothetical protein